MSARTDFDAFVEEVPENLVPICQELRNIVAKLHPQNVELVWLKQRIASYGVGPKKMTEHYVYIAPQSKHVNLGLYYGAGVKDPTGLLEGTGKSMRHVKLRSLAEMKAAPIRKLIAEAIAERKRATS